MICPRCKKEMNDDAIYCPHCGLKLEKCPSCHQPIIPHSKFCSYCGTSIVPPTSQNQENGYYQPLVETVDNQEPMTEELKPSFQDIEVNKKVNKKVIVIAVIILALLTGVGYWYLFYTPGIEYKKSAGEYVPQFDLKIESTNSFSTYTGNINQNGEAYFDGTSLFVTDMNGHIVKMDAKLENRQTIVNTKSGYLTVVNETIYYTNDKNQFCAVSIDGTDGEIIIEKDVYYPIVKDNKIYYQLDEDNESIHVYDTSTKEDKKINDKASYNINVVDDKIYYLSNDGIYVIGIDGKGEEKLISGEHLNLVYQDGCIYYASNGMLCSYDIKTKDIKTLVLSNVYSFLNMNDEYIYYLTTSSTVASYHLKNKETESVYNGSANSLYIVGDKLIIKKSSSSTNSNGPDTLIMDLKGDVQQVLFSENNGKFI